MDNPQTKLVKKEIQEHCQALEKEMGDGDSLDGISDVTQQKTAMYVGRIHELKAVIREFFSHREE